MRRLRIGMSKATVLVLSMMFLASCQKDEDPVESPITFGIRHDKALSDYESIASNSGAYSAGVDYPDFEPVVFMRFSNSVGGVKELVATGTLVHEQWILTAAHNFFEDEIQAVPTPVSEIEIFASNNPNIPGTILQVEKLIFHPTWLQQSDDFLKANDLCLIKLTAPFSGVNPAIINTSSAELLQDKVWFAGFGDYSGQPGQDPIPYSKRHAFENELDRKNNGIISDSSGTQYSGGLLAIDFDTPLGDINALGDGIANPDELLLGNGTSNSVALDFEGTTVPGDSGGPIFMRINGAWRVVGVLSGGAQDPVFDYIQGSYGDISVFIRISTQSAWINSVIN